MGHGMGGIHKRPRGATFDGSRSHTSTATVGVQEGETAARCAKVHFGAEVTRQTVAAQR